MTIGAVGADRHIIYYRVVRTIYGTVGLRITQIESFGCGHTVERIASNLQTQGVNWSNPLAHTDAV